jgi:Flp pilus assembly protein TadB
MSQSRGAGRRSRERDALPGLGSAKHVPRPRGKTRAPRVRDAQGEAHRMSDQGQKRESGRPTPGGHGHGLGSVHQRPLYIALFGLLVIAGTHELWRRGYVAVVWVALLCTVVLAMYALRRRRDARLRREKVRKPRRVRR